MIRSVLVLLVGLLLFAQTGQDPPDDPNPEWEGQKASCNNYKNTPHKCQCALATSCDAHKQKNPDLLGDGMGSKCQTYCRKEHCNCLSPCST